MPMALTHFDDLVLGFEVSTAIPMISCRIIFHFLFHKFQSKFILCAGVKLHVFMFHLGADHTITMPCSINYAVLDGVVLM